MPTTTAKKRSTRVEIQDRDLEMLEVIYSLRFATAEHLAKLFPASDYRIINPQGQFRAGAEGIANRLKKLHRHHYLIRIGWPVRASNEPQVYALDEMGARALAQFRNYDFPELAAQVDYTHKYLKHKSQRYVHLNHRLGINDFRVALALGLREHPTAGWLLDQENRPYWTETQNRQYIKVRFNPNDLPAKLKARLKDSTTIGQTPDAVFILKPDKNQDHTIAYIFEKDQGTEDHDRLALKLFCYFQFHQQKLHYHFFATKHLRVLVETESPTRLNNMIKKAAVPVAPPNGSGIFWFTTSDSFSLDEPAKLLSPIWTIGHLNHWQEKHSLLEFSLPATHI